MWIFSISCLSFSWGLILVADKQISPIDQLGTPSTSWSSKRYWNTGAPCPEFQAGLFGKVLVESSCLAVFLEPWRFAAGSSVVSVRDGGNGVPSALGDQIISNSTHQFLLPNNEAGLEMIDFISALSSSCNSLYKLSILGVINHCDPSLFSLIIASIHFKKSFLAVSMDHLGCPPSPWGTELGKGSLTAEQSFSSDWSSDSVWEQDWIQANRIECRKTAGNWSSALVGKNSLLNFVQSIRLVRAKIIHFKLFVVKKLHLGEILTGLSRTLSFVSLPPEIPAAPEMTQKGGFNWVTSFN